MASVEARKTAPPEKPESTRIRTRVVFSFWAIILFLGVPVWLKTTSIYRAALPLQDMLDWAESAVRFYSHQSAISYSDMC
jgi:phosphatidylinositol glycan class S